MIDFRCIGLPVCRKQKRTELSTITFFSPTFPMFCNHNFATTLTKASLPRMIKCYFIFMSVANCFNIIFPVSTLLKMNTWPTIPAFQSPDLQYLQQLKTIKTWTIYSHKKKKEKNHYVYSYSSYKPLSTLYPEHCSSSICTKLSISCLFLYYSL